MNVGIVGSKDFQPLEWVTRMVDYLPRDTQLVITTQLGAPRAAEEHARLKNMRPCIKVPLGFCDRNDKTKFHAELRTRNENLVSKSDVVAAFWDGQDYGIKEIIELTARAGIPVFLFSTPMTDETAAMLIANVVDAAVNRTAIGVVN
jgi:hypothetical protein